MPQLPDRKTIRLQHYDYHSKGVYHVTICSRDRKRLFGAVIDGRMALNALGEIADRNVQAIPGYYPEAEVMEYVVMPNHVHILLGMGTETDANYGVPTVEHSLGQIIRAYKASVSKACGTSVWQPRFYEHIIRNEQDLLETVSYIRNNPKAWDKDDLYAPFSSNP